MRFSTFQTSRALLPLQQSPAYARTLRSLGRQTQMVQEHGIASALIVGIQTPFGHLRSVIRGPVWETADREEKVDFLLRHSIHILNAEQEDRLAFKQAKFWHAATESSTAVIDLRDEPLVACRPKWRNAYRQATRSGVHVAQSNFDATRDGWIMDMEAAQQKAVGYRGYPRTFTLEFSRLNPDAVVTYVARFCGEPIAAMIFLKHRPSATYHIGWSGAEGRQRNAHHLLMLLAMRDFKADGINHVDLGQIDTVRSPGLARFKIGAGARVLTLGGTWIRRPGWRDALGYVTQAFKS